MVFFGKSISIVLHIFWSHKDNFCEHITFGRMRAANLSCVCCRVPLDSRHILFMEEIILGHCFKKFLKRLPYGEHISKWI